LETVYLDEYPEAMNISLNWRLDISLNWRLDILGIIGGGTPRPNITMIQSFKPWSLEGYCFPDQNSVLGEAVKDCFRTWISAIMISIAVFPFLQSITVRPNPFQSSNDILEGISGRQIYLGDVVEDTVQHLKGLMDDEQPPLEGILD